MDHQLLLMHYRQLVAPSRCGSYMTTGSGGDCTVAIVKIISQTSETVTAWRLTEEGAMDGVSADGRADRSNSIWTIPVSGHPELLIEDQVVVIEVEGDVVRAYHPETGEVLDPVQVVPPFRPPGGLRFGRYPHKTGLSMWGSPSEHGGAASWTISEEGWMEDPEWKHRMWLPVEWREACLSGDR